MTSNRITRITALVLVALVAFTGVADAKRKKKKRKPVRVVATLPFEGRNLHQSAASVLLASGKMPGETAESLRPDDPLDGPALQAFVAAVLPKSAKRTRQIPAGQPVTMGDVNAIFVQAAGMESTAARAEELVANAGYVVRPGLGTEIVARLMRLRTNLDQSEDAKEHAWYEQASRGDAIWSAAVVLQWGGWEKQAAIDTVELLAQVPQTSGPQHDAIQRAFDFIGMPYVWGGTSEQPQILFGANTAGGFDCSGFAWRILALDPTAPKHAAKNFGGRTTFDMARTAKPEQRLPREAIAPADILLFGPGGLTAAHGGINHMGMAISPQLFIHSSGQGVALARWDTGYYADRLAFGKRIL
jgi:hypothetical protein